jgi:hypothetical protein
MRPGLLLVTLLAACGDGNGPGGVATLAVTPLLDSVFVGDTIAAGQFMAAYRDAAGQPQPAGTVRWSSSSAAILTVDSVTGRAVAVAPGIALVQASARGVVGRALVIVSRELEVALLLDTLYLMPGDTLTVPVEVRRRGGGPPPVWFPPSPNPAVYTVDSATGRVTAVAQGPLTPLVARADTVADSGAVEVVVLTDTTGGKAYYAILGTAIRRARAPARALNYERVGDTLTFRLDASLAAGGVTFENVVVTLRTPITVPGVFAIDSITPAEAFGTGSNFVCRPTRAWALWSTSTATLELAAVSRDGSIGVTRVTPVTGGFAISGWFRFTARRTDVYDDPLGRLPVRGTFVAPLIANTTTCN